MRALSHTSCLAGAALALALAAPAQDQLPGASAYSGGDEVSCPPTAGQAAQITFTPALIDDAMALPLPTSSSCFVLGGGPYYGRHAACILYLTLVANHDPNARSSSGALVLERAVAHIKATASAAATPHFAGGHTSWFDAHVPLAYAVARRNPALWSQLTVAQRDHLDLVMQHVLHTAAIFCQTNRTATWSKSTVLVDMYGDPSGYLPNQSAPWHAYLVGSYVYWGGVAGMDALLAGYDLELFKNRLAAAGLTQLLSYYEDPRIAALLEGVDQSGTLGSGWAVDPRGVRKSIARFNTRSLVGSPAGFEHAYGRFDPLTTHPRNLVYRWGHEYYAGAQPRSNVGPGVGSPCNGTVFGLVDDEGNLRATLPYELQGRGMPYEFNSRSTTRGPHNRSSWNYSKWGWNFYAFMYGTVAALGYFDPPCNAQDQQLYQQVRKTTELIRFVGDNKWRSSAGIPSQICTWNHGDAYGAFAGDHWAQDVMDAFVFSGAPLPQDPAVP